MKPIWKLLISLIMMLGLAIGCTNADAIEPVTKADPAPTAVPTAQTPTTVVDAFYTWYIGLLQDRASANFVNPLRAGLYRDSDLLYADFIAQIDANLASQGELGGYDPLLLAQDVPVSFELEEPSINGDEATIVMLRTWGGNPDPSPMVVHLTQANSRWQISNVTPFEIPAAPDVVQPAAPNADTDPTEVVQTFFDWYIDLIADRADGNFINPLAAGLHHSSPYLTSQFADRIDETMAGFAQSAYDPILLAQDIPTGVMAYAPIPEGAKLRVPLVRYWSGGTNPDHIFVRLRQQDGVWLINDVCPGDFYAAGSDTPEGTVQTFFDWYTTQIRRRFEDDSVSADFHDSPLLTNSFKQHLDEMIAAAEAANPGMGLHADPILCAQDVPVFVAPLQAFVVDSTAVLAARTSFPNQVMAIDLRRAGDGWQISDIDCRGSADTVARAFYAWYLGYLGDRSAAVAPNPLSNGAYRWQPLLSPALVAEVDTLAGPEGGFDHDPFLLAQAIPANFSVGPGVEENTAVVHFQFGHDSVNHVLVRVADGKITAIEKAEPLPSAAPAADLANVFRSLEYSFAISFPDGWVMQPLSMDGPGQPDDWPVVAAWQILPADLAQTLSDLSSSGPDPSGLPPPVAPFLLEVVVGDEEAVARVSRPLTEGETITINGRSVTKFTNDPGYSQYIFTHPDLADRWFILTDYVTTFPGRETQAETAAPVLQPVLQSLHFFN